MKVLRRPLLLFDGDCSFCRLWIERWRRSSGESVDYASSQQRGAEFPDVAPDVFERTVVLVDVDGCVYQGAHAVLRTLAASGHDRLLVAYQRLPGFAPAAELAYRLVAANRGLASFVTRLLLPVSPARYLLTRRCFLAGMGLVYLAAFVSLWVQVHGLLGSSGITPADELLQRAAAAVPGPLHWWRWPTLMWLWPGDISLHLLCAGGVVAALMMVGGRALVAASTVAWLLYLSLFTVGGVFLSFQWDILLLEAGVLAPFLALGWRAGRAPSRAALLLYRLLLFKLMFMSGVVKLMADDPAWWNLSALDFHYWTQPLPPWTAWYADKLPAGVQRVSTALMFAIELLLPFALLAGRRGRQLAAAGFALLMVVISFTGNYGFFNLLTLVLCLPLLDDHAIDRLLPARAAGLLRGPPGDGATAAAGAGAVSAAARLAGLAAMLLLAALSLGHMTGRLLGYAVLPPALRSTMTSLSPLHLAGGYGLFARMTRQRSEIVVEGSLDGRQWKAYEFRYKPGDPARRPAFVAPHMPRLDWQMWFAALGDYRHNPWLTAFMRRLLQGSPAVMGLLGDDPFDGRAPRYLRALRYDYHFSPGSDDDAWWRREPRGLYAPVMERR
ncbi:MAG: lipase maturation factor family protein [bacterium]